MKLSEKLLTIASWLENPDSELIRSAENNEEHLFLIAEAVTKASLILKESAEKIEMLEPKEEITPEFLDELAAVASSFDNSEDELLKKQASVLDELLLTLASPKNYIYEFKKAEQEKIDALKKKYKDPKSEIDLANKAENHLKAIEESPYYKKYRALEAPLSTRYCPDHPGSQILRIGEHIWQCEMDKKIYDFDKGFTTMKGEIVPGGGVEMQTPPSYQEGHHIFDSRESRLGTGKK